MFLGGIITPAARRLLGIISVALLSAATVGGDSQPRPLSLQKLIEPPSGSYYLGVFPGSKNGMGADVSLDDVKIYEGAVGKPPAWVYFWNNWYDDPWTDQIGKDTKKQQKEKQQ